MATLEKQLTGMGSRPALLVVDAINAFTDPQCPLGSAVEMELQAIGALLDKFRGLALPIYFTTQFYDQPEQASVWREKLPSLVYLKSGHKMVEVDPRLGRRENETIIAKQAPSAFFETDLKQSLLDDGVDTVFVVGFTTSGCVRASGVDAVSSNFRTIVVPEGCGDRDARAHESNLYDLEAKYADLIPLRDALDMLNHAFAKAS